MVQFRRRDKKRMKFHGPNHSKPTDLEGTAIEGTPPPEKAESKSPKRVKCGEQEDCPLRSKCKAGICQP